MAAHGTFIWNELLTKDAGKAKDFYTNVLGWMVDEMDMPNGGKYSVMKAADSPAGGIMNLSDTQAPDRPSHWMAYIAVDDVDAAVDKVKSSGGKVDAPPFDVPGVGRIAVITDPTGATVGLMTPAEQG